MDERTALVALSMIAEPGDQQFQQYIHEFDTASDAVLGLRAKQDLGAPMYVDVLDRVLPRLDQALGNGGLDRTLRAIEDHGVQVVTPLATVFGSMPQHNQPTCLFVQGDVSLLRPPKRVLGIVGARAATAYGERVATDLVEWGRMLEVEVIVSGAAYGIDGAAHRAALASAMPTVAILAGGLDRYYPSGHQSLIERITASGAVVSELPPGFSPTRFRFLSRNRLIAAMSSALVVAEAGARSGSLNAASHAVAFGVPLGAVPGSIYSASSAGCHRLLKEFGARPITEREDLAPLLKVGFF
jgi:DNA processing protein